MIALNYAGDRLAQICQQYEIKELSVFGSIARGEARADSDLDILVEFDPKAVIGFIALSQLRHELEQLFQRSVDLVTKPGLHTRIREQILSEAEVLFAA